MEAVIESAQAADANPRKKKYLSPDASRNLAIETERAKELRAQLIEQFGGDDESLIQDTLEGETTLDDAIDAVLRSIDDDQILIDGISERQSELADRKDRAKKRIESKKALIEQAMISVNLLKLIVPIGTVSLRKNQPKLMIDEESKIPSQFWVRPEPIVDNAALKDALKERDAKIEAAMQAAGDNEEAFKLLMADIDKTNPPIPGAHMEPQGMSMALRRK